MAQNFVYSGHTINAVPTDPEDPKSGDPVVVGTIPGVAETDAGAGGNETGACTIKTKGAFDLTVTGTADGTTPAAVGVGDRLYYADGVISKLNTGVLYGKALGTVDVGDPDPLTAKIPVLLVQG